MKTLVMMVLLLSGCAVQVEDGECSVPYTEAPTREEMLTYTCAMRHCNSICDAEGRFEDPVPKCEACLLENGCCGPTPLKGIQ